MFTDFTAITVDDGTLYVSTAVGVFDPQAPGEFSSQWVYAFSVGADLFLRIQPTPTTVHQGDLITYAFPVWNLGPANAVHEVLNTQVPAGTTFDYIRISGTPGLGDMHDPAISGNRTNRLSPKRQHGSEHHVDGAADGEGDGSRRHGDHRECGHHGGYDRPEYGQ